MRVHKNFASNFYPNTDSKITLQVTKFMLYHTLDHASCQYSTIIIMKILIAYASADHG